MRAVRAWVVLAGLLPASACAPAAVAAATPQRPRLLAIAAAWRSGDARAIARYCTRAGRVQFDLAGAQGSYGAEQLEMVLARVFERRQTRSFAFEDDEREAAAATAFARANWEHRARAGGRETREMLTFALRLEGGEWRIVEMRSSP